MKCAQYRCKLIFLVILICLLFKCKKDLTSFDKELFFPPDKLDKLALEHVGIFWKDDTISNISDYVTANFDLHPDHYKSIRYSSKKKILAVSVFKSKKSAIQAMEERIGEVALPIARDDSAYWKIRDTWWWGGSLKTRRVIFINKWNTIIEAGLFNETPTDSLWLLLEDTAIEIANRIDRLSK